MVIYMAQYQNEDEKMNIEDGRVESGWKMPLRVVFMRSLARNGASTLLNELG